MYELNQHQEHRWSDSAIAWKYDLAYDPDDPSTFDHNIGLIIIPKLSFSNGIQPICLPESKLMILTKQC